MIPNAKVCLYPSDPAEAVRVLAEHGSRALILAGGTSTSLSRSTEVDTLVDLTRIGHDTIQREGDGWSIGCNVRLQQLAQHDGLAKEANGMLCQAAAAVGSRPIRNAVTVAGNLVQLFRWSDTPVAWLALGAQVELFGPDGPRRLSVDELLSAGPRKALGSSEIVLGLNLPAQAQRVGAFTKYARTATDYSIVDAAVSLSGSDGQASEARLVVGGARRRPFRVAPAENMLCSGKLTKGRIAKVAQAVREGTKAIPDTRTSRAYREQMVEVIMRRTIERAAAHLKEQG